MTSLDGDPTLSVQRALTLEAVDTSLLGDCVLVEEFCDPAELQSDYRDLWHVLRSDIILEGYVDYDVARQYMRALQDVGSFLLRSSKTVQGISQQVFKFGSVLSPHTDDNAINDETEFTLIVPIAHPGVFTVHDTSTRAKKYEFEYRPGNALLINQQPPTLHSANSRFSMDDFNSGFADRRIWSIDCASSTQ